MTIEQKQCLLKYLGYYKGEVDGVWGKQSAHGTMGFQDDYGLDPDGVFGPITEDMAKKAVAGLAQPVEAPAEPEPAPEETEAPGSFWAEIKHFKREEFRCKCGGKYCNGFPVEPSEKLVRMADRVREHFGVPAIVSSGVRCKTHNARVGGVSGSRHQYGTALDVRFKGIRSAVALPYIQAQPECNYAYAIDSDYIHMDVVI